MCTMFTTFPSFPFLLLSALPVSPTPLHCHDFLFNNIYEILYIYNTTIYSVSLELPNQSQFHKLKLVSP